MRDVAARARPHGHRARPGLGPDRPARRRRATCAASPTTPPRWRTRSASTALARPRAHGPARRPAASSARDRSAGRRPRAASSRDRRRPDAARVQRRCRRGSASTRASARSARSTRRSSSSPFPGLLQPHRPAGDRRARRRRRRLPARGAVRRPAGLRGAAARARRPARGASSAGPTGIPPGFGRRARSSSPRPAATARVARARGSTPNSSTSRSRSSVCARRAQEQPAEQADGEDALLDHHHRAGQRLVAQPRVGVLVEGVVRPQEDVAEHGAGQPRGDDVAEPRQVAEPRRLGQRPEQRHPQVHGEEQEARVLERRAATGARPRPRRAAAGARRRG